MAIHNIFIINLTFSQNVDPISKSIGAVAWKLTSVVIVTSLSKGKKLFPESLKRPVRNTCAVAH
jgi:hypothetical protein